MVSLPATADATPLTSRVFLKIGQRGVVHSDDLLALHAAAEIIDQPVIITALSLDSPSHHEWIGEYDLRIRHLLPPPFGGMALPGRAAVDDFKAALRQQGFLVSEEGPQPGAVHTGAAPHLHVERQVDRTQKPGPFRR